MAWYLRNENIHRDLNLKVVEDEIAGQKARHQARFASQSKAKSPLKDYYSKAQLKRKVRLGRGGCQARLEIDTAWDHSLPASETSCQQLSQPDALIKFAIFVGHNVDISEMSFLLLRAGQEQNRRSTVSSSSSSSSLQLRQKSLCGAPSLFASLL
ncbi:GL18098 [Drosophila persimilis]|uniref:GL18098 n=1 Tax=Drosophila persimilis TaxID=7234 RepID=B4HC27_DROPE|nr:GL18098 [Drosophila persimilis]